MLDPIRSITGNPLFYIFKSDKDIGAKGGFKGECPDGFIRIKDLCTITGTTDQAIRGYAKRNGICINKGLLANEHCNDIIAYYANSETQ